VDLQRKFLSLVDLEIHIPHSVAFVNNVPRLDSAKEQLLYFTPPDNKYRAAEIRRSRHGLTLNLPICAGVGTEVTVRVLFNAVQ
jgi:hypothetical protein